MQNYTTQMDAARKGIVTPEMEIVAKKEYRTTEEIRQLVAEGKVAIPANKHHTCLNPEGIGSMLRTKINVNLGVSRDCKDYNVEMEKVMSAVNMGAEAIMDLSSHGNTQPFRQKLTHECPVMIGTVPAPHLCRAGRCRKRRHQPPRPRHGKAGSRARRIFGRMSRREKLNRTI